MRNILGTRLSSLVCERERGGGSGGVNYLLLPPPTPIQTRVLLTRLPRKLVKKLINKISRAYRYRLSKPPWMQKSLPSHLEFQKQVLPFLTALKMSLLLLLPGKREEERCKLRAISSGEGGKNPPLTVYRIRCCSIDLQLFTNMCAMRQIKVWRKFKSRKCSTPVKREEGIAFEPILFL